MRTTDLHRADGKMAQKHSSSFRKFLLGSAVALIAVSSLSGCSTMRRPGDTTGSIPSLGKPVEEMNQTELSAATNTIGAAYAKNPKDRNAGLNYATLLRMTGRNGQALAVMQQVAINNPQ